MVLDHRHAAAQHHAIFFRHEVLRALRLREQAAVVDQGLDAAGGVEVLARHGRHVDHLRAVFIFQQRIAFELRFEQFAIGKLRHVAHAVDDDHFLEHRVNLGIAHKAHEGGKAGAGREHEQPLARQQRVRHQRAGRLLAEIDRIADLDVLEPRGQRAVLHLDREELQLLGIGRRGDRIGAQQRLAVVTRQADHHELARTKAEACRTRHLEREQPLAPVVDIGDGLDRKRRAFGELVAVDGGLGQDGPRIQLWCRPDAGGGAGAQMD